VQDELVELFQYFDARFIGGDKLLAIVLGYLVLLVLDVPGEIEQTSRLGCQHLVLSRTVATCIRLSAR
jgi:hypothetical protein